MNKVLTGINGGFPLTQELWAFHQDATAEAIKGLMSAYGVTQNQVVILSGCDRTESLGVITVTEGFVSIGGEVCFFPEQTYPSPLAPDNQEYFNIKLTFDPNGLKPFETSGNQNTIQVRTAEIVIDSVVPVGYTSYFDTKSLFEIMRDKVRIGEWTQFFDYNNDAWYGAGLTPAEEYRKYFKDIDGFVHLKGASVEDDPAGADIILCQLPIGFRPPSTLKHIYTYRTSATSAVFFNIEIRENGDIVVIAANSTFTIWLHELPAFKV